MTYYFPFLSAIGDGNNTDLTSMVVMKEPRIKDVLTEDDHFIQVGMGLDLEGCRRCMVLGCFEA